MINLSRALGLAEARKLELEHVTVHSSERVVLFYQRRASRAGTPACKGDRSERLAAAILICRESRVHPVINSIRLIRCGCVSWCVGWELRWTLVEIGTRPVSLVGSGAACAVPRSVCGRGAVVRRGAGGPDRQNRGRRPGWRGCSRRARAGRVLALPVPDCGSGLSTRPFRG